LKKNKIGAAIPHLNKNIFFSLFFPLPPLEEQKRIVEKYNELFPFIEKYDLKETQLNQLNNNFPDQLKKSILQEAVQGKLVPQDPNDEPASVLLDKIRTEKQCLISEGKLKKDKNESIIFRRDNSHYEKRGSVEVCIDNEIPFDIPNSWEWIRMGSLVQINPKNIADNNDKAGFIPMQLIDGGFCNNHTYEIRKWQEIKTGFTHFANNDVVIAKITPCFQNRKSSVINNLPNGIGAGTTELHVLRDNTKLLYMPYILMICKTNDFIINGMKHFIGTAGQQRIGKDYISNFLVPLPPYNEQKRIVKTCNSIISKIDALNN
jgi:type I restriction enzyme S subunit